MIDDWGVNGGLGRGMYSTGIGLDPGTNPLRDDNNNLLQTPPYYTDNGPQARSFGQGIANFLENRHINKNSSYIA